MLMLKMCPLYIKKVGICSSVPAFSKVAGHHVETLQIQKLLKNDLQKACAA